MQVNCRSLIIRDFIQIDPWQNKQKAPAHPGEPLDGEKSLVLFMPWCRFFFAREKLGERNPQCGHRWYLLVSFSLRVNTTQCCTAITKDKNVQMKEAMCSRYSIRTRSSLIPVYMGFSYLHFLCLWTYVFTYLWSHKEVWSAWILHTVNFTM